MAGTGDSDLAARVEEELREQGLTRTVTDPGVLRQVAGLLGAEDAGARERRLAQVQRELADVELRFRLDEGLPDVAAPP
jgi:adenylylsulfate kinase-like enzyme